VTIELGAGPENSAYDIVISPRTDAQGNLSQKLAIPMSAEPGAEWVVAAMTEDESMQALSNPFEVIAPQYEPVVQISPPSGPPGTEVQVVVEGFPPNTTVEIGVGPENAEYDVVNTMQTGSDGALTTRVVIPGSVAPAPSAASQERWVVVVTTQDRSVDAVSNVFQLEQAQYQGAVAISPTSGPRGTHVDVTAEDFPPHTTVDIGIGRVNSEYDVIATAQTDATGRAETQIIIPAFVEPEDTWVIVVAAEHRPIKAASREFDVTPGPTPTPSEEDLFTRTNIYLIAVGDEGQAGKEIGCGDSVVPVEVEIDPTIAPLTAALNELLSLENREYGQSGLYNALYRSDLTLEGIDIEDREAIINLSGELVLGGTCDAPRVRAQLRQTALQYVTIDQVSIFLNGEPLADLLAQD
jgi:hypothetical protein